MLYIYHTLINIYIDLSRQSTQSPQFLVTIPTSISPFSVETGGARLNFAEKTRLWKTLF